MIPLLDNFAPGCVSGEKLSGLLFPHAGRYSIPDVPGAGGAFLCAATLSVPGASCLVAVLPGPNELNSFLADTDCFMPDAVYAFPMTNPAGDDPRSVAMCLNTAEKLVNGSDRPFLVATCVHALARPLPDTGLTEELSLKLRTGKDMDPAGLIDWLSDSGYRRGEEVYERIMFAVKGGIVDVWPSAADGPVRIEFFGDTVESIRLFDTATQRSVRKINEISLTPAVIPDEKKIRFADAVPSGAAVLWIDYWAGSDSIRANSVCPEASGACETLERRNDLTQIFCGDPPPAAAATLPQLIFETPFPNAGERIPDLDVVVSRRTKLLRELSEKAKRGEIIVNICLDTSGSADHFKAEAGPETPLHVHLAPVSGGFVFKPPGKPDVVFLSQAELYGSPKRSKTRLRDRSATLDITIPDAVSPTDAFAPFALEHIEPGDLVVHAEHGIGKYVGMSEMIFDGKRSEVICIEYAGHSKLYVPPSKAHLVSRYTGTENTPVKPHSLGGKRWNAEKESAAAAIRDLAAQMLRTQAIRMNTPGFAFSRETPWLSDFEASFPHTETEGQLECIARVKEDMISSHPMDRLICGDAGYGKTEIAMRAAFICAMQGKQVAVLAPTTVLAQQHYETFRERMAEYPLNIAVHSRFCSQAERKRTIDGMADGSVDIVIGTHGILRPDVVFKDLGLVIIDEEQRFGVRDKEHFKSVRALVDVLTLSATPIPRTLYLGLTGARDLSVLKTPPRERVATETKIVRRTDRVIVNAVRTELERGGQVFYLHNRVMSMELVFRHLSDILPEARICMAHGKMPPTQIEKITHDFANGKYDVLVSTTIIENGIDIPRANTIIIDRADRFGIADLYQLRGRVGRGAVKAFAYLMIPDGGIIDSDARKRLAALRQNSDLGAGLNLAMRDLGIRGAGNLLGAEQSGHIAAIGFSLYCQLLRAAVAKMSGQAPPLIVDVDVNLPFLDMSPSSANAQNGASLPYRYIDEDSRRIAFHRRLAECSSEKELEDLYGDITDRFGKMPDQTRRLFDVMRCRILSAMRGITRIDMREHELCIYINRIPYRLPDGKLPRPAGKTADELLRSITNIIRSFPASRE